jgi:GTP cyclohydrolase I
MQILGLDLTDESLKDTPARVAKMYVNETFAGLNPENQPKATLFENNYQYKENDKDIFYFFTNDGFIYFVPIFGNNFIFF